ncbi:MAG: MATE family efflux transporter [Lachnospiraceae bacterium]|jgi:Na+-driven multidrug efflux pump|nr:MATE family efflux transporter [Lachnospiraceae bacterium]
MEERKNPLGELPVGTLLRKFAIPSIVAMLVSALYNIVDQFFIGHSIGELGNAATNIAFPLSISCTSIALLLGIGGASAFNLAMGEGDKERAPFYIGNSATALAGLGLILAIITEVFLDKLLVFFGSPMDVLPYAKEYTRITAIGFPMLILQTGGAHLVRADGSPKYSMIVNMTGAVINTILDALFIFKFNWGMKGAALATIIGQFVAGAMVIAYLANYKTIKLKLKHFLIHLQYVSRSASLGTASFFNQIAMMVVQIIMNNSLKYYGAQSVYGESIPIACAGIISKVGMMFFSFIIGISQGLQPIVSFNYGAKKFERVKKATKLALFVSLLISIGSFLVFQIFPRQIIGLFGEGSEDYYNFAVRYFRIYFFFVFINFVQPIISNFFTATGRPQRGMFLSLTRQILFLIPLLIILPRFFGINGIIYSGPIADAIAVTVTIIMGVTELSNPRYKENLS